MHYILDDSTTICSGQMVPVSRTKHSILLPLSDDDADDDVDDDDVFE